MRRTGVEQVSQSPERGLAGSHDEPSRATARVGALAPQEALQQARANGHTMSGFVQFSRRSHMLVARCRHCYLGVVLYRTGGVFVDSPALTERCRLETGR